jgi:peptide/nickel transport system permease protein
MNYYIKRFGQAALTLWVVVTLAFVMVRLMPGGPVDYLTAQFVEQGYPLTRAYELANQYTNIVSDAPLHIQYLNYMEDVLLNLDFGNSTWYSLSVWEIIFQAMPWTIFLMSMALLLRFLFGIALGAVMAFYEGGKFDIGATVVSLLANSVPYYIVALLLLLLFAYNTGWFPVSGRYPNGVDVGLNLAFFTGLFYHAILPVASMVISGVGGLAVGMRANAIQTIGEDYIYVARLRGLPDSRISLRYVAHNAVLPMYTGFMISIGSVFGGSVILEEIFRYQGIGFFFFKAVSARDYPLMMGGFIVTTFAVIAGILIADLTYGMIDPRISVENES